MFQFVSKQSPNIHKVVIMKKLGVFKKITTFVSKLV